MKSLNDYILEKLKLSGKGSDMFVDMGLPSGVEWCKYNLGVNPSKLNKKDDWIGNYYAWGETEPKETYELKNYSFYKEGSTEYVSRYTSKDKNNSKNVLNDKDDAANKTNKTWHTPSRIDYEELIGNCDVEYVKNYNDIDELNGFIFTSKINNEKLFFPLNKIYKESGHTNGKNDTRLWTSMYVGTTAYILDIHQFNDKLMWVNASSAHERFTGMPIRPIKK